jgi:SAM-dependent methyltransferase
MTTDQEKTIQAWTGVAERFGTRKTGMFWWDAGPEIHNRINRNISGDPSCDYTTHVLRTYYPESKRPFGPCLSLGCGNGFLERSLSRQGAFERLDAYDLTEAQLILARKLAKDEGLHNITYHVGDLNEIELPPAVYESVWIQGALHHVESLEHLCYQVSRSLKPEGLFILNEYIGPNRFQFSARQKELTNLCLQLLPQKYRVIVQESAAIQGEQSIRKRGVGWFYQRLMDKVRDGDLVNTVRRRLASRRNRRSSEVPLKTTIAFPAVGDVIASDPSEAIRSGEILDVLRKDFRIVESADLGGNILQFLLADIAGNFSNQDEESQAVLRMLIQVEETLMACGEFKSDFGFVVARPK